MNIDYCDSCGQMHLGDCPMPVTGVVVEARLRREVERLRTENTRLRVANEEIAVIARDCELWRILNICEAALSESEGSEG